MSQEHSSLFPGVEINIRLSTKHSVSKPISKTVSQRHLTHEFFKSLSLSFFLSVPTHLSVYLIPCRSPCLTLSVRRYVNHFDSKKYFEILLSLSLRHKKKKRMTPKSFVLGGAVYMDTEASLHVESPRRKRLRWIIMMLLIREHIL